MEEVLQWVIPLLSGAVGGNLAGSLMKKFSMGTLWNSVVGILGGGVGATILSLIGINAGGGMDLSGILGSVAGGGVGGGVIMAIIGMIKNAMNKG